MTALTEAPRTTPPAAASPAVSGESGRFLGWLFLVLAALYAVPLWVGRYLPTIDGPCHTYNAWVVGRQLAGDRLSVLRHLEIAPLPFPNWASAALLAALMELVPAPVAEKAFVTATIWLFLAGLYYAVATFRAPGERWVALLGVPLAYSWFLASGFYNFTLGVALLLPTLAVWWRRRESPGMASAVGINLLLWAGYFSHPLIFAAQGLGVALLWLVSVRDLPRRSSAAHALALLPQLALPVWSVLDASGGFLPDRWSARQLLGYFLELRALHGFAPWRAWLAQGLFAAVALAAVGALLHLLRRRARTWRSPAVALLALAACCLLAYVWGPAGFAGGYLLRERLAFLALLVAIPALAVPLARTPRRAIVAALAAVAVLDAAGLTVAFATADRRLVDYLAPLAAAPRGRAILALHFDGARFGPQAYLGHAVAYAAIDRQLLDWDDYQAKLRMFPVRFRRNRFPPIPPAHAPEQLAVRAICPQVGLVYTWQLPPGGVRGRLRRYYQRIAQANGGELWQRKPGACR